MEAGVVVLPVAAYIHYVSVYAGNYNTREGSLYASFKSYSILPFTH